jgi:hypothetical protein
MIPNALTAARGFVMRKVAGRFDACRQLVSSGGGVCVRPSLLATVGVFVLMLMPILLAMAAIAAALHLPSHSLMHFADVIPAVGAVSVRELKEKKAKALADARSVFDTAERENRAMTGEEETRYTAFMNDVRSLGQRVTRGEALIEEERQIAAGNPNPGAVARRADPRRRSADADWTPSWHRLRRQHHGVRQAQADPASARQAHQGQQRHAAMVPGTEALVRDRLAYKFGVSRWKRPT